MSVFTVVCMCLILSVVTVSWHVWECFKKKKKKKKKLDLGLFLSLSHSPCLKKKSRHVVILESVVHSVVRSFNMNMNIHVNLLFTLKAHSICVRCANIIAISSPMFFSAHNLNSPHFIQEFKTFSMQSVEPSTSSFPFPQETLRLGKPSGPECANKHKRILVLFCPHERHQVWTTNTSDSRKQWDVREMSHFYSLCAYCVQAASLLHTANSFCWTVVIFLSFSVFLCLQHKPCEGIYRLFARN